MEPPNPTSREARTDELFAEALELPSDARVGFVNLRCGGNEKLRDGVLHLLSKYQKLGDFLEVSRFEQAPQYLFVAGEVLGGRFRIVEGVGQGGLGEVYRARDEQLGETVALKVLRPRWGSTDRVAARFRDEIRLARRIAHPNVCRIFDLFVERRGAEEILYFTMELVDGVTVAQRLGAIGRFSAEAALEIGAQIASGLDAAHRLGIVHRDLKPGNLMLAPDEKGMVRAVITDFGLAKLSCAGDTGAGHTVTGEIFGTLAYMAPEQLLGEDISAATDVFAFALVLYEMLTGRLPYPPENPLRSAIQRILSEPQPVSKYAPGLPASWNSIFAKALTADPAGRYPSAGDLVVALRQRRGPRRIPKISRRAWLYTAAGVFPVASFLAASRFIHWRPTLPEQPVVMLAPFTTSPGWMQEPPVPGALDVLLAAQVQQSAHVRVLSQGRVREAWQRIAGTGAEMPRSLDPRTARDIALRQGAQFVVFGHFGRLGDDIVLQLQLELLGSAVQRGAYTWREQFASQDANPRAAVYNELNDAGAWIRRTSGESAAGLQAKSRRVEELTTSSWDALQDFTNANDAWDRGDGNSAIHYLESALRPEKDPQFALAAARLGDVLDALGRRDEGLPSYRSATELIRRKNLTDRESLRIAGLFALDTGQNGEAEQAFTRYALEYPQDALPLFYKAAAVYRQGREEEAASLFTQAAQLEPTPAFVLGRAGGLMGLGRLDGAEKVLGSMAKQLRSDGADQLRSAIAVGRFRLGDCWTSLENMRLTGSPAYRSKAWSLEACLRAEQGRWVEAERLLRDGLSFVAQNGLGPQAEFGKKRQIAQLYLRQGKAGDAARLCREMLAGGPGHEDRMQAGCLLAQAGDVPRARQCLVPSLPDWPCYTHWTQRLRAELALAGGESRLAWKYAQAAPAHPTAAWPEYRARIAYAAGEREAASKLFDLLFKNPARHWYQADENSPGVFSWAAACVKGMHLADVDMKNLQSLEGALATLR
jgi:tetratricopeptide (TPR) repeat protein